MALVRANKLNINIKRIPTGVFSIDALTGGGIPENKVTIFHGNKSSGKTTTALKTMGNYLQMYEDKEALYVDIEDSYDDAWMSNFIEDEDMDRILVDRPLYAEEAIDSIISTLNSDKYNIGFLLVDSLANFIPIIDAEKSAMDDTVGTVAKAVNKLIRKLLPIKRRYNNEGKSLTILFLNQSRVKIGSPAFASGTTKPGGSYQDFIAHLDIRFYQAGSIKKGELTIKLKHKFKIEKSKIGKALPHTEGAFSIVLKDHDGLLVGQSDDYAVIFNKAKHYNVIKRKGNKWDVLGKEYRVQQDILDAMKVDKELYYTLYNETIQAIINAKIDSEGGE